MITPIGTVLATYRKQLANRRARWVWRATLVLFAVCVWLDPWFGCFTVAWMVASVLDWREK